MTGVRYDGFSRFPHLNFTVTVAARARRISFVIPRASFWRGSITCRGFGITDRKSPLEPDFFHSLIVCSAVQVRFLTHTHQLVQESVDITIRPPLCLLTALADFTNGSLSGIAILLSQSFLINTRLFCTFDTSQGRKRNHKCFFAQFQSFAVRLNKTKGWTAREPLVCPQKFYFFIEDLTSAKREKKIKKSPTPHPLRRLIFLFLRLWTD